jgi:hypothetical protein
MITTVHQVHCTIKCIVVVPESVLRLTQEAFAPVVIPTLGSYVFDGRKELAGLFTSKHNILRCNMEVAAVLSGCNNSDSMRADEFK